MNTKLQLAIIGEFPPPGGGMAIQADLMASRLLVEKISVVTVRSNYNFSGILQWMNTVRGLRGVLRLLIFLFQCIRITKVDVIHLFSNSDLSFFLFSFPPIVLARLLGKPIIINYHGGAAKEFFRKNPRMLSWMDSNSHSLIVPSGYLQEVFSGFGYEADIIQNFTNTEHFKFRKRELATPHIIISRHLTPVYNIACAIRVFSIIKHKFADATLTIAGDGVERKNLETLVIELNLNNVTFLGAVNNKEMPIVYNKANIFLNTSQVDNMPNSILEAYVCGLPVVSTNPGGIPFMVKHKETGLLSSVDDHNSLSECIIDLVENPELKDKITAAGKKYIDDISWDIIKEKWITLYRDATINKRR